MPDDPANNNQNPNDPQNGSPSDTSQPPMSDPNKATSTTTNVEPIMPLGSPPPVTGVGPTPETAPPPPIIDSDTKPTYMDVESPPKDSVDAAIKDASGQTPIPPPKRKVSGKLIAGLVGLLILAGGLFSGIQLVGEQQELREQAAGIINDGPGGCCDPNNAYDPVDGCRDWEVCRDGNGACETNASCRVTEGNGCSQQSDCDSGLQCINNICRQPGSQIGSCEVPDVSFFGASTPGFDCTQGTSASVGIRAQRPEGCQNTVTISYNEVNATCNGEGYAGCQGACGNAGSGKTLVLGPNESYKEASVSCSVPACGSCQVDISYNGQDYGVRRWQDTGCSQEPTPTTPPQPTNTPTQAPTVTPSPTPTPVGIAYCQAKQAYRDSATNSPGQYTYSQLIETGGSVAPGETIVFRTRLRPLGFNQPSTFTDVLNSNLEFVDSVGQGTACNYSETTRKLTCNVPSIANSDSAAVIGFRARVKQDATGTIENRATMTTGNTTQDTPCRTNFVVSTTPPAVAACLDLRVYNNTTEWKQLTVQELRQLKPGDKIILAVRGAGSGYDKAHFRVNNNTQWGSDITAVNNDGYFYVEYALSPNTTTFKIEAQVHHEGTNQWY